MLINPLTTWFLLAHPHVFIDYTVDFMFNENGLIGMKTEWFFDEMYSSMLLQDYDVNKDGEFSSDEIVKTEKDAFSNLANYNYFIYITNKDKCLKVRTVSDFSVRVSEDRVIYNFFIAYVVPANPSYQEIEVCMYDETYYVDLLPMGENPVHFSNAETIDYEYEVFEDTKESKNYGEIYPYSIRLMFRKKE